MNKKILISILLLAFAVGSKAQLNFVAGVGTGIYVSKYIVDDNLAIDLNDYHSTAFNFAPNLHIGIDLSNRMRFVVGLASTSKTDMTSDLSYIDSLINPNTDYSAVVKNQYLTIPVSLTFNLVGKDAKSRLPIGLTADMNMLNKQKITSSTLDTLGGLKFPVTYTKSELTDKYDATSFTVGFTVGYGYRFTDNLGLDALLFAKYDLSSFDNTNTLYNNYAFVGLNLTLYYVFGKKKD
ncbi:hypothetical protein LBMAG27_24040 [Bacteroidota bacterium]|nr:hypothetical protein LBMAG27_24040 [Bacteroidota bacterium]